MPTIEAQFLNLKRVRIHYWTKSAHVQALCLLLCADRITAVWRADVVIAWELGGRMYVWHTGILSKIDIISVECYESYSARTCTCMYTLGKACLVVVTVDKKL